MEHRGMRRIGDHPHPIEVTQGIGDRQGLIPIAFIRGSRV